MTIEQAATFEPYNAHLIRDIGAFQLGLGAVSLLLATRLRDTLLAALTDVAIGAIAHTAAHILDRDLDTANRPSTSPHSGSSRSC